MLVARNIEKRLGTLQALQDVSATFVPGEIHAVIGENGAGKSTLMSVLSGFLAPDGGSVALAGKEIAYGKPSAVKRIGIEMIHQHFTLVPAFTVAENLALARIGRLGSLMDPAAIAAPALEKARELNWSLDPAARVRDLPVGVQQRLEILKAIAADSKVVILDEPTAVLTPEEVDELFGVLRTLRSEGRIIILIAHKLTEVMEIADRVTVIRLGRVVGEAAIRDVDPDTLARWMVGELPPLSNRPSQAPGAVAIKVQAASVRGDRGEVAIREASFEVRSGEIFGFGGVDGNGQLELAEAIAGVRKVVAGSISVEGYAGYIPQDRQADGLALAMTIQDNMSVAAPRAKGLTKHGLLNPRRLRDWTESLIERYEIKASGPRELAGSLSGGNQQKIVVSRVLSLEPNVIVAMNPTRGLDVRAAAFVRRKLLEERERGAAIALFTTDLDELYELSDRVLFMSSGMLVEPTGATAYLGAKR